MDIEWNLILRIFIAGVLGGLIGFEREFRAKEAGVRTHFIVALGSALFMIISQFAFSGRFDAARVAAQVVSGIGFIGAGVIGETMVMSICEAIPTVKTIYICDLDLPKAEKIAAEYKDKYPGIEIIPTADSKAAAAKSELIMGETTARTPFIDKDWVKPHSAIVCVSNEATKDVALMADVKVVDYWKQMVTFKNKAIVKAFDAGELTRDQILETSDLVLGKPCRTSDDQFIYACSLGLGALDITVAYKLYQNAMKMGLGTKIKMWDKPLWE